MFGVEHMADGPYATKGEAEEVLLKEGYQPLGAGDHDFRSEYFTYRRLDDRQYRYGVVIEVIKGFRLQITSSPIPSGRKVKP